MLLPDFRSLRERPSGLQSYFIGTSTSITKLSSGVFNKSVSYCSM